jgi:hypothetical protein
MDTPSRPRKQRDRKKTEKRASSQNTGPMGEPIVPLMLRPKVSQKACAERLAHQMEVKRSQLDPSFYLTGALLTGVERLGKAEHIGTWTRKEVAAYLKSSFTALFELLYEQDELPLAFALLLSRGGTVPVPQSDQGQPLSSGVPDKGKQDLHPLASPSGPGMPSFLPADAQISLDGFPEDI